MWTTYVLHGADFTYSIYIYMRESSCICEYVVCMRAICIIYIYIYVYIYTYATVIYFISYEFLLFYAVCICV